MSSRREGLPQNEAMYELYNNKLARYYDQIYHWKDYKKEADTIKGLIQKHTRTDGKDLLDVGCGTGRHLHYLQKDFQCVGLDLSEAMLKVARKNVPGVRFVKSSMTDFRIGRKFDVVLCLFSSMGYLKTRDEISRAVYNFAKHLKEGGVLIIEPWLKKSDWVRGSIHMRNFESTSLLISRVGYSQARGSYSVMDERYLIAEKGKGIIYVEDHQQMRFFEPEWTFEALKRAGFNPRFSDVELTPGRTPIIATKRKHATFRLSA